jgi:glycosyltransferase involved in cell wall biosynthesis
MNWAVRLLVFRPHKSIGFLTGTRLMDRHSLSASHLTDWWPGGAKLKIGMLAACPFPANHGTPGSIREMSEAIVAEGHEVHVVTYHIGEDIPLNGPVLHRIPRLTNETGVVVGPTVRRPLYDLQMVFRAREVVTKYRLDVIHAHGYEAALVACLCNLATGVPVVYSGHQIMEDELASYNFFRPKWVATAIAKLLDAVVPRIGHRCIPHSVNIQQFFFRKGLRGRTEPIVNFGIDLDWVRRGDPSTVRARYPLGNGPIVLYAGVLDRFQRIDLLLEAIAQLRAYVPSVKLLIVSTVPHAGHVASIRQMAGQFGVAGSLILTEPQPLEAIPDFLHACDVAIVPRPLTAGFPIKLLNYMAAARPCVLFASSASQGLKHGENVYLAAPDTAAALGEGILEVLRDDALRQRIAANGHRFVREHHNRSLIARRVCASYFRTLADTGRLAGVLKRQTNVSPVLERTPVEVIDRAVEPTYRPTVMPAMARGVIG